MNPCAETTLFLVILTISTGIFTSFVLDNVTKVIFAEDIPHNRPTPINCDMCYKECCLYDNCARCL